MQRWATIPKPEAIANEVGYYFDKWKLTDQSLVNIYTRLEEKRLSFKRGIYKFVLVPNKNLFIVLAGSLASVPINVLTGPVDDLCYLAIKSVVSVLFYVFFLRLMIISYKVREEGDEYVDVSTKKDLLPHAKKNVSFAACTSNYERIQSSFVLTIAFLVATILSFILPAII